MGIEAHAWGSHDDTLRCCGISRDFAWSAVGTFDKNEVGDEVSDNGLSQVKVGSKEEGLHRVLVRGDRTVSMGKGGLEMGENFGSGGPMGGGDGGVGDGRTASEQGGTDRGLATIEAFPESLPCARASWRAGVATPCLAFFPSSLDHPDGPHACDFPREVRVVDHFDHIVHVLVGPRLFLREAVSAR